MRRFAFIRQIRITYRVLCVHSNKSVKNSSTFSKTNKLYTMNVTVGKQKVTLSDDNNSFVYFHFWLRDHCRCNDCYNHVTSQRKLKATDIPIEIEPKTCSLIEGNNILKIKWNDDHESTYEVKWLEKFSYENHLKRNTRNHVLWTKSEVENFPIAHVNYDELLQDNSKGVSQLVKSLVDYGFGFVEKVPPDLQSTEKAVLKISHVQHTLFGGMWSFSDSMDHSDTAYTKEALGAHTDNTYFTEAAGLQILHCLKHDGTGGENLLLDGFKALSILEKNHPAAFERLSKTPTGAEYLEPNFHHEFCSPIIKFNILTNQIEQIRFNLNDRAPLSLPTDQIIQHYEDLKILTKIIEDSNLELWVKLNPGTVLFFDNFRVLHGRAAYTGHRVMCGCYLGRGDFLSKARVLNLI